MERDWSLFNFTLLAVRRDGYTLNMRSIVEKVEIEYLGTNLGEPKFAHYAESISVTEGYIMGRPVKAICGQLFVPSRDPLKFPVCPICKELADALLLDVGQK